MEAKVIHYPNLKTVLAVERILKEAELTISREEIKRRLPVSIMHQTLNVILRYFSERGMTLEGDKGVLWIYNPDPKLNKAIKKSREI